MQHTVATDHAVAISPRASRTQTLLASMSSLVLLVALLLALLRAVGAPPAAAATPARSIGPAVAAPSWR